MFALHVNGVVVGTLNEVIPVLKISETDSRVPSVSTVRERDSAGWNAF